VIQLVEAFLLGFVHGRLLENAPRLGAGQGLHSMNGVFCRVAASFSQLFKFVPGLELLSSLVYPN
jgi:hypothetical protein